MPANRAAEAQRAQVPGLVRAELRQASHVKAVFYARASMAAAGQRRELAPEPAIGKFAREGE